jgi:hypothetical protein
MKTILTKQGLSEKNGNKSNRKQLTKQHNQQQKIKTFDNGQHTPREVK